jgi:hypothetical protein
MSLYLSNLSSGDYSFDTLMKARSVDNRKQDPFSLMESGNLLD